MKMWSIRFIDKQEVLIIKSAANVIPGPVCITDKNLSNVVKYVL